MPGLASLWRRWNGLERGPLELPPAAAWRECCAGFVADLAQQADLTTQLLAAASGETPAAC